MDELIYHAALFAEDSVYLQDETEVESSRAMTVADARPPGLACSSRYRTCTSFDTATLSTQPLTAVLSARLQRARRRDAALLMSARPCSVARRGSGACGRCCAVLCMYVRDR